MHSSRSSRWAAWVVCPTVLLLSYVTDLNLIARGIFVLFVIWWLANILLLKKRFYPFAPLIIYLVWAFYALLPSIFSVNPELSLSKWLTVVTIGLVSLATAHAVVWSGSARGWGWAYLVSTLLVYLSSTPAIASLFPHIYSAEVFNRSVGTLGNANLYGRTMVQAILLAFLVFILERKAYRRGIIIGLILIFVLGVIESGSRTALIGLFLAAGVLFASMGFRKLFFGKGLLILVGLTIGGVLVSLLSAAKGRASWDRLEVFFSFVGLVEKVQTKERSLEHRIELLQSALGQWLEHPFGIGLGNFHTVSGTYAHSNYFELLATVGIIGLIIFYLGHLHFSRLLWQIYRSFPTQSVESHAAKLLLGFVAVMLVLDIPSVSYYAKPLWLLFGILIGQTNLLNRHVMAQGGIISVETSNQSS